MPSNIIILSQLELRNKCDDSHDGTRERWRTKPSRFPHTLCCSFVFLLLFFYYGSGDSSSWREVKERGFTDAWINCPGKSFGAVPVALVNETVAMCIAIRVEPIAVAVAAPDILALKTGLLCPPYTNCAIIACWCKHVGVCRIPTYTVDTARVTSQSLNEITSCSMPYVDLETWQVLHIITSLSMLAGAE